MDPVLSRRWTLTWSVVGAVIFGGGMLYSRGAGDEFFWGFLAGVGVLAFIQLIWFTIQSRR
jgi:hypothetical protein